MNQKLQKGKTYTVKLMLNKQISENLSKEFTKINKLKDSQNGFI